MAISSQRFVSQFEPGTFPWPEGKRVAVSLSFDDAHPSQADAGLSILGRHQVRATFYVMPVAVQKNLDAWKRVRDAGHEIGNHTLTHPCSGNFQWSRARALEDLTLDQMRTDIAAADVEIHRLLGVRPATFAYPCGQTFVGRGVERRSYTPVIAEHFVAGRGFRQEVHNDPSYCDLAHVGAFDFDETTFAHFLARLRTAETERGWLVLAGHEVSVAGRQSVLAETLDAVCRHCCEPANGIWIETMAAVAAYICRVRDNSRSDPPGPPANLSTGTIDPQ